MQNEISYIARDHDWYWQITGKAKPAYAQAHVVIVPTVVTMLLVWSLSLMVAAKVGAMGLVLVLSLVTSSLLALSMEAYYILVATHRVTSLITSRHWDLLRLTPLRPEIIFADLYVTIELRCYKAMVAEVALRILAVTSFLGLAVGGGNNATTGLFVWVVVCCPAAIVFGAVVMEPFGLLPTIVALGIAVGATIKNFLFALVVGIALVSVHHLLRVAWIGFALLIGLRAGMGEWAVFCAATLGTLIVAAYSQMVSTALRYRAIRYAQREMFRPE